MKLCETMQVDIPNLCQDAASDICRHLDTTPMQEEANQPVQHAIIGRVVPNLIPALAMDDDVPLQLLSRTHTSSLTQHDVCFAFGFIIFFSFNFYLRLTIYRLHKHTMILEYSR